MSDKGTVAGNKLQRELIQKLNQSYNDIKDDVLSTMDIELIEYLAMDEYARIDYDLLTNDASDKLASNGKKNSDMILAFVASIYKINKDFVQNQITSQITSPVNFDNYDKRQLDILNQNIMPPLSKIAYRKMENKNIIQRRLIHQLKQAILRGESQDEIIERIRRSIERTEWEAKRIAQTERTRIQSQARHDVMQDAREMGIKLKKRWLTRMVNSRHSHSQQNNETVEMDQKFSNGLEYPGDPRGSAGEIINCHCVLQPIVER
jgi:hypothetical protein